MKKRYPDTYNLFEKLEQENPGMFGYVRGTVETAREQIRKHTSSMLDRAKLQKEREFEQTSEAKQPKCFKSDHQVMKDLERIVGDHTWRDDLKKVNPGYYDDDMSDETGIHPHGDNCQRCVVAYEARRRGFKAEADVVLSDKQTAASLWWDCFGLGADDVIAPENRSLQEMKANPLTAEQLRKKTDIIMSDFGNGARAIVKFSYKDEFQKDSMVDLGHVFIAENHNGVIRYIDPQTGDENYLQAFEDARPESLYLCRIDDKPFKDFAAGWCVRGD